MGNMLCTYFVYRSISQLTERWAWIMTTTIYIVFEFRPSIVEPAATLNLDVVNKGMERMQAMKGKNPDLP